MTDLLNTDDAEDTVNAPNLSHEEQLVKDLVNLAATIRDNGQVNPLTAVDVSDGASIQYRIETGERRYWTTWLLKNFFPGYTHDGKHQMVYRHCYERPDLHKLQNRSGELWQPLVALAAFFEGQGIGGLLNAIAQAAEFDQQFSEGNALGEREEALLQSLELLTRNQSDSFIWLKAVDMREAVQKF